jgi:dynein intermediate chain, cytosolic
MLSLGIGEGSRPGSAQLRGPSSPAGGRASRPTSVTSAGQLASGSEHASSSPPPQYASTTAQTLSIAPMRTVLEESGIAHPKPETYNRAVQTSSDFWNGTAVQTSDSEDEGSPTRRKRKREAELAEIRQNLRKEIEEEIKATTQHSDLTNGHAVHDTFTTRTLSDEELLAVNASEDFQEFIEKSTKIIDRALEEEYDILADYGGTGAQGLNDDDDEPSSRKGTRIKQVLQFWDEKWSKRRMITDIDFSTKVTSFTLQYKLWKLIAQHSFQSSFSLPTPRTHLHLQTQTV